MAYIFDTTATTQTAIQSVLKAATSAGGKIPNLRLRTDNGPQYSSREFKKSMQALGIRHEFIWKNTPEQNGHVESFHGTLKRRLDPLLFFKPAHPAFQARFRQTACSASHSNLWFTSPHTMSLMRSYVFSGFRYLSPMIRHVLTLRIACST